MIVLKTSALIELLTDGRDLRQVVATRLLAEDLGAPLVTTDMKFEPLAETGMIRCPGETLTL